VTRRTLVATPLALAAKPSQVRLGAPVFSKTQDPVELAREHKRLGYRAAYVPSFANLQNAAAVEAAFRAEDVVIAEVGAWKNMLDPEPAARQANLDYVTERMALAEAVGARCCVDIAGSFHPKVWYAPHRDNLGLRFFDATVENCRKVIDAVKPKRTKFSLEMMGWSLPDTPESYLRLIKAIDRPQGFGVHVDACNLINSPEKLYRNTALIEDCFRKLGRWVLSCHAKDVAWVHELQVHFVEVIPGRGEVDYSAYLRAIAALPQDVPLMLEHLKTHEQYTEGFEYIRKVAASPA
jgi:sugar phosphate isomerase/epimerase